jgi:signal transduction histidine kinase
MVHNGPLTVLTMALHAGAAQPTATLRRRAGAVLNALPRLGAVGTPGDGVHVRLDELVSQVAVWYSPPLRITADLHPVLVPADVADAITGAVSEALENTARHAATDRVSIVLRENAGTVRAAVIDAGRGFDSEVASGHGFGLREDLVGRMAAIGGMAMIRSAPAAGSAVELEWRHG